jgi:hypothetical protein
VSLKAKRRLSGIIPIAIAAFILGITLGILLTLTLTSLD